MTRLAPAAAPLLGLLLLACGGDDGDERGPNATATVAAPEATRAPETTTPAAPASTATPEVLVQAVGAVEPLALVQDGSLSASLPDAVVYEIERRAEILPETEIYARAWLEVSGPLVYTEEGTLARFDPTARRWVRLDLGEGITQYVASPDGSRAAVSVGGRTHLLEFEGKGSQQEISTRGRPVVFSPAETKLLLLMPEQEGLSPFVVAPVDNPAAAVRLPLGASPNAVAQHSPQWLNDDRLLLVSQKTNLLQVFDVSTPAPRIVLEETIPSEQAALSPDGSRLAVLDPGADRVERQPLHRGDGHAVVSLVDPQKPDLELQSADRLVDVVRQACVEHCSVVAVHLMGFLRGDGDVPHAVDAGDEATRNP